MTRLQLSALATRIRRSTLVRDIITLCDGVHELLGRPCQECEKRRTENAARVQKHRKRKATAT